MPTLTALNLAQPRGAAVVEAHAPATVRAVIVAPTHNNAKTLPDILRRIEDLGLSAIVVNDGSTDSTAAILNDWAKQSAEHRVLMHPHNQGKAAALKTGLAEAFKLGFTHGITLDTDGQLAPEDIPRLLTNVDLVPSAMVLGVRDVGASDYPSRSRIGRNISNFLVRFETGRKVSDSQCGLRIYPLEFVNAVQCRAEHYGFETEVITRAIWAGVPVLEVPVQCKYFDLDQRVSHFKPFLDSVRALRMHARLIATAMNPFHRTDTTPGAAPLHSLPRQFLHWLNPITAWRQIRNHQGARTRFAAGFGIGVFIANMPLYGIQTILGLFVARRFRLHPASVLAGVNIAVPPIGPLMIAIGIALGHLILHGSLPHLQTYRGGQWHALLVPTLIEWCIGSVIFGIISGAISFAAVDCLLRMVSDVKPAEEPA